MPGVDALLQLRQVVRLDQAWLGGWSMDANRARREEDSRRRPGSLDHGLDDGVGEPIVHHRDTAAIQRDPVRFLAVMNGKYMQVSRTNPAEAP